MQSLGRLFASSVPNSAEATQGALNRTASDMRLKHRWENWVGSPGGTVQVKPPSSPPMQGSGTGPQAKVQYSSQKFFSLSLSLARSLALSLSLYIYTYTHTRTHLCNYVCTYVRAYVCMYVCMYVCICICMYVCMCACVHVCMCVYVYVRNCMYACMHACMNTCVISTGLSSKAQVCRHMG